MAPNISLRGKILACCLCLAGVTDTFSQTSDKKAELERLLAMLNLPLLEKCEHDVRVVLDPKIVQYGEFGLYPDPADTDQTKFFQMNGDKAVVSFLHRGLFHSTADYFLTVGYYQ